MKTIKLNIPLTYSALSRAATMLKGIAEDLTDSQIIDNTVDDADLGDPVTDEEAPEERDAAAAFDDAEKLADSATGSAVSTATTTSDPAHAAMTTNTTTTAEDGPFYTEAGVEIDKPGGLPWDHRINALGAGGVHPKLKKTGDWKLKRGVDPVLVEQVQEELKAAMAAPAPGPAATTEQKPADDTTEDTDAIIWTFGSLMAAITAAGFPKETVLAAVKSQGLVAVPLLASRPDLIPGVAAKLGLS